MTVRLLVLNAPLVFCHGVDKGVCSIPMSRRTTMSFAVLRTVALANQSLEDPVPTLKTASSLVPLATSGGCLGCVINRSLRHL